LTVKLSDVTEALYHKSPEAFYAAPMNIEQGWQNTMSNPYERHAIPLALVVPLTGYRSVTQQMIYHAQDI
jgi:hypothetical protein